MFLSLKLDICAKLAQFPVTEGRALLVDAILGLQKPN